MVSDKIGIINLALGKLASERITMLGRLTTDSEESLIAANCYDDIRREVLEEHSWRFAQKRAALDYVVADDTSRTIEVDIFTPILITAATATDPVVITADNHGLYNHQKIIITGVSGMTQLNSNTYYVKDKTNDTFSLTDEDGDDIDGSAFTAYTSGGQIQRAEHNTPITITAATAAEPVQLTTLSVHGLAVDDWVKIIGVQGMTNLNDNFYQIKTVPTTTSFTLKETDADDEGDDLDGTAFTAYTFGGVVLPCPELTVVDAYVPIVYQAPADMLRPTKKSVREAYTTHELDKVISDIDQLKIIYTYDCKDVTKYSPKFIQALATRLAAEIGFNITNSVAKAKELMQLYESVVLPDAVAIDSTKGSPDEVMHDAWLEEMDVGPRFATTGETWTPF